ncbi:ABC transporter permease [Roseateles sp. BYS180W]|uniref:ABC transporter permease n=1 Tax=Roseateles rivi TaxID=3299028 RepID=A0ABW7FV82_9BURK
MKYLHLIWAALFRRKLRTLLTLVSIVTAFLLFGLLDAVRVGFDQAGQSSAGATRLQTASKLSFIQTLPMALHQRIAGVEGVKEVTYANWFGGAYKDPHNQVVSFAVAPNYLDVYPEMLVSAPERAAFAQERTGALVGEKLAKRFGWKVGDQIPMQSTIFPDRNGSQNWQFKIVGLIRSADTQRSGWHDQLFLLNWKYFDETTPYNQGNAGWFVARVNNVQQADKVAKAIDALAANSDHETRTMSEQAAMSSWIKQLADIGLIVSAIMGAVFFTLLLLAGNTMMQAIRERTTEIAVLKTIGFGDRSILVMVLVESVLLLGLGGAIGLALASGMAPAITAASGGTVNLPAAGLSSWAFGLGLALVFGLLVGALPALNAMRLNVTDALSGRA